MSDLFYNIKTGEKVKILSDDGTFITLNNGYKVDKMIFSQKYQPYDKQLENIRLSKKSEYINPEKFLNQKTNVIVENKQSGNNNVAKISNEKINPEEFLNTPPTIQNIDVVMNANTSSNMNENTSTVQTGSIDTGDLPSVSNENTIIQVNDDNLSEEQKKKRLLEDYYKKNNIKVPQNLNINNNNDIKLNDDIKLNNTKIQNKKKLNENGLTEYEEQVRREQIELNDIDPYKDKIKKYKEKQYKINKEKQLKSKINNIIVDNPDYEVFKKFKRDYDVIINLEIKDKISKPDFIKIISEGLEEVDVIQYYTDKLFENFVNDMKLIKNSIYNQLYKIVYNKKREEKIKNKNIKKIKLIPGKKTKSGKQKYKYLNESNKVIEVLPSTAIKKKYKPYKNDR